MPTVPGISAELLGQDMREVLFRKLGTDLTAIEGIGINTYQ